MVLADTQRDAELEAEFLSGSDLSDIAPVYKSAVEIKSLQELDEAYYEDYPFGENDSDQTCFEFMSALEPEPVPVRYPNPNQTEMSL